MKVVATLKNFLARWLLSGLLIFPMMEPVEKVVREEIQEGKTFSSSTMYVKPCSNQKRIL